MLLLADDSRLRVTPLRCDAATGDLIASVTILSAEPVAGGSGELRRELQEAALDAMRLMYLLLDNLPPGLVVADIMLAQLGDEAQVASRVVYLPNPEEEAVDARFNALMAKLDKLEVQNAASDTRIA